MGRAQNARPFLVTIAFMKSDDLVVVRTFNTEIGAELAKSALEAADIDSFIQTDDAGGTRPHILIFDALF